MHVIYHGEHPIFFMGIFAWILCLVACEALLPPYI